MQNPFHWRGMVMHPDAFIGRKRELGAIFWRLRTFSCVAVVGKRRIGKSSLLYQAWSRVAREVGADCRAVYIDALSATCHRLDGLLRAILEGLGAEARGAVGEGPAEELAAFEGSVRELRATGCMPVVFLDEVEHLAGRVDQFGDNALESWRSLCNAGQMAFVTASQRPLNLVARETGWTSPFYNMFSTLRLEEFAEQEATEFAKWAVRVGGFEASDREFILRVGQRHPLRMMVAACHLFEARRGDGDYGGVERRVDDDMGPMLGEGGW